MVRRRALIESDAQGQDPDLEIVKHKWGLYLELMRYAEGESCRHDTILRYFGDDEETLAAQGWLPKQRTRNSLAGRLFLGPRMLLPLRIAP